jgi:tryptophan-rich sensory protein
MEYLKFVMHVLLMAATAKPLEILFKKTKTTTQTKNKIIMYFIQIILAILTCYFFYKMAITAASWRER